MSDSKNWYQSKTIWGALIAIVASVLQASGDSIDAGAQTQIVDGLVSLSGAMGGLVAIYGRLSAERRVS